MLTKVYNALDSHREVGLPEAISHLCEFPDHYTSATFININTKTLLYYMNRQQQCLPPTTETLSHESSITRTETSSLQIDPSDIFDSEILSTRKGYRLMSPFDDYIYRGRHLSHICLYDYHRLFYKEHDLDGIAFDDRHPQSRTHCQILR
jgi:hypothetical protein